jgi:hypothetical protein
MQRTDFIPKDLLSRYTPYHEMDVQASGAISTSNPPKGISLRYPYRQVASSLEPSPHEVYLPPIGTIYLKIDVSRARHPALCIAGRNL